MDVVSLGLAKADAAKKYTPRKLGAPIASGTAGTGSGNTLREYPSFKKLPNRVMPFSVQTRPSTLWLCPVDMRGWPGALASLYIFYSTDHGVDSTTTGIALVTADDPYGTNLTDRGRIFAGPGGGASQAETPSVWLDWDAGLVRMLYQVNTGTPVSGFSATNVQNTRMATSPTGLPGTWTDVGVCMTQPSPTTPGFWHTGYATPWRAGGQMYAYTLAGSDACALWMSNGDGLPGTWQPDLRRLMAIDAVAHIPGYGQDWLVEFHNGSVFDYRGRFWWVGRIGGAAGGGTVTAGDLYTAPLTEDFRHFASRLQKVTPAGVSFSQLGRAFQWNDQVLMPYRDLTGGQQGDWYLMQLDQGV